MLSEHSPSTTGLKEAIRKRRIFPSYLFVGADGAGKLKAALNFAKALNCSCPYFCETCLSCRKINSGNHPDVFLLQPEGISASIGIDRIRAVIAAANLKPYEGKWKVFIINNAHSMNEAASNAFLKTLEEPPENTVFILISPSKELLLSTIVSRSSVVRFKEEKGDSVLFSKRTLSPFSLSSDREELKENLEHLVSFFRDVFLYKTVKNEKMLFSPGRLEEIKSEAGRLTCDRLDYLIKRLITLRSYIDYNVNPKIIVDVVTNELEKIGKYGFPLPRE